MLAILPACAAPRRMDNNPASTTPPAPRTIVTGELPQVTLGLPVRNGAALLDKAITAALAQDYPHITLLISDNCSTDATPDICARHAAADPRIRYHRQTRDLGAIGNFEWLARQADGEYFMWVAHDDTRAPDCVSQLVAGLSAQPAAIIAYGDVEEIALDGSRRMIPFDGDTSGLALAERLRKTAQPQFFQTYGLWRRAALQRLSFGATAWGQEVPMMMAAACLGEVVHVPGAVLYYRVNPKPYWQLRMSRDDALPWGGLIAKLPQAVQPFVPRFAMSRLVWGTFGAVRRVAGLRAGLYAGWLMILWLGRQIRVWTLGRLPARGRG